MAKAWAKSFYNSAAWKAVRNNYIMQRIKLNGGLCEVCDEQVGYIVHHIRELTPANINDPMIALNADNLMYVCKECHDRFDGHFLGVHKHSGKRVEFGSNGQPLPPIL